MTAMISGPASASAWAIDPSNATATEFPELPAGTANNAEDEVPEIPVDDDYMDGDSDSAYGDSIESDTCSLASSITRYRYENGRRYHAYRDGAYWAPNDEIQNDQQDIAHHLYLLTLDGQLHLAPIRNPHKILDIGTGTGIWVIDMADKYPSAICTGIDLSPTQPEWTAPNCFFEIDDVTLPWTFRPASFDFIHIREMFGSISDWDDLFAQSYHTLKPGGWMENVEHSVTPVSDDDTIGPDHIFTQYGTLMVELARRRGKEFDCWHRNRDRIVNAGFVDVVELRAKWPMRGWSSDPKMKEVGRWNQLRVERGIEGFAMRSMTAAGMSYSEVQAYVGRIREALGDRSIHGYLDISIIYGRKPMDT